MELGGAPGASREVMGGDAPLFGVEQAKCIGEGVHIDFFERSEGGAPGGGGPGARSGGIRLNVELVRLLVVMQE